MKKRKKENETTEQRLSRREPREWIHSFSWGEEVFTVRICRFYESSHYVMMEVVPGGRVEFRIPWNMPPETAEKMAEERKEWIRKRRPKFMGLPDTPLCRYEEGERHPYFGEFYPLKLFRGSRESAVFREGTLCLTLSSPERPEKVQELLWEFYRREAALVCEEYFREHLPRFKARGMKQNPQLRMRYLTRSWGRCNYHSEKVSLSIFLAAYSKACIEEVVVHELCHFFHCNHSAAFYAAMDIMLPGWRERKELFRRISLFAISQKYPL